MKGKQKSVKRAWLVIQQGGASGEYYPNLYDTKREAVLFRRACANAAYNTSEPIKLPATLAGHPALLELVADVIIGMSSLL